MLIGDPELEEGMKAFMEKREPRFPQPQNQARGAKILPSSDSG
jgi:hypothetical protein